MMTVPVVVAYSAPTRSQPPSAAAALFAEVNGQRALRGLRLLVLDERLCTVARSHGRDMAERKYFEHVSPEGLTPFDRLDRAHVRYAYAAENLALAPDLQSASRALLDSREHRANMLEPHFTRVGIAAVDSASGVLFVEDFSD